MKTTGAGLRKDAMSGAAAPPSAARIGITIGTGATATGTAALEQQSYRAFTQQSPRKRALCCLGDAGWRRCRP